MYDYEALLAPISSDRPAGENLRYDQVYDDIQEARRADDQLAQGEWQHSLKTSDWPAVRSQCRDALASRTKDIQIAVWLLESLTVLQGFEGVGIGLRLISSLIDSFWEDLYPVMEDGDIEYRVGPLEFMNDKISLLVRSIPLTDGQKARQLSMLDYEESRQVGSEKDTQNEFGDVNPQRKKAREEMLAEGKLSVEAFESAVRATSRSFYETLNTHVSDCMEQFKALDAILDDRFGREAPRIAELKTALEESQRCVARIVDQKRAQEPVAREEAPESPDHVREPESGDDPAIDAAMGPEQLPSPVQALTSGRFHVNRLLGGAGMEEAVWEDTMKKLKTHGIKPALEQLLGASCSAQSVREKTNYRLLIARLCLKAERPDLARPVLEELTSLIEELNLARWESPIWIAEALGTLYQCLTARGASDYDLEKAAELLPEICTLDITKAVDYSEAERSL